MINDNNADPHSYKNRGTFEPSLNNNETTHDCQNNSACHDDLTPPPYLNEAPDLDYNDCYIPDDEYSYDDLAVICGASEIINESADKDDRVVIVDDNDATTQRLLKRNGYDYQKVAEIINENGGYKKIISKRYLGDAVLKASKKVKFLLIKSGMGTGKTTAMKEVIASLGDDACILFVSPRKKLNLAIARDLGLSYYEDVKKETDKKKKARLARRIAITPQSLGEILKAHPEIKYEYVVLDESQAITKTFKATVAKDKLGMIVALKQACRLANHVIAMDAFLGKLTKGLVKELAGEELVGELTNVEKTWKDFNATLITGGKYTDRVKAINALQIEAISSGKVIYIASSSAAYCNLRESVLKSSYRNLRILNITGKSKAEAEKILSNPETIKQWDVIIGSPAIAIGVSFDVENHVDEVFGIFPNSRSTGDSEDSRQSLTRVRKPKGKKWTIVLDDDKKVFAQTVQSYEDIGKAIVGRMARAYIETGELPVAITEDEESTIKVSAMAQFEFKRDKNNFNEIFLNSLINDLGVTINELDYKAVEEDEEGEKRTKEKEEEAKRKEIEAKTISPRIDEEEANKVKFLIKFNPEKVTQEKEDSYERYKVESKFNINFDNLDEEETNLYLKHDEEGTIKKLITREKLFASKEFDKKYMRSRIFGREGKSRLAFKVDMLDDRLNYPLLKSILKYSLPYIDGKEYSDASLKKERSLIKFIERNYKEIVALDVVALPSSWRKNPSRLMSKLLSLMGYGRKTKRIRGNGKKRLYKYTITKNDEVEAIYERRIEEGRGWVKSVNEIMDLYDEVKCRVSEQNPVSPMGLIEILPSKLGMKYIEPAHVVEILRGFDKVPAHDQSIVVDNFIADAVGNCLNTAVENLKFQVRKRA